MKKSAAIHKALSIFVYMVMLTGMVWLLTIVFRYPQNHLISRQMMLGTAAFTAILLTVGLCLTLTLHDEKIRKKYNN